VNSTNSFAKKQLSFDKKCKTHSNN